MITVFTPTYNRLKLLPRLFDSLLKQTCFDFEWVVVDDGSTDETEEYFKNLLKKEYSFKITYVKQENGGKHRAINKGVSLASGEAFIILDSDDYLIETAIEKIINWFESLDDSHKFAGVSGDKGYSLNKCVGKTQKSEYIDATNLQRRRYGLLADKAEIYFTSVLKKYPFPEFENENFLTEEVVWNAIASDGYYIRWFNEIIYICDYLDDGLTKNGLDKYEKNPKGTLYWAKQMLTLKQSGFKSKIKAIDRYSSVVNKKYKKREIAKQLDINLLYLLFALFIARVKKLVK